MTIVACSVANCELTETFARGYCRPHYRRFLKYGDPLGERTRVAQQQCTVLGCEKDARSKTSQLCKMHYHRQYRGGEIGGASEKIRKQRDLECNIEGCDKPDQEVGLCRMHAARKRRHGDPLTVIPLSERQFKYGEEHHNWVGADAKYGTAHCRVKAARGVASAHRCVDCNGAAKHWSYNHSDPSEKYAYHLSANPIAYSDSPEHYSPRCVSCHKRFDMGRKDALLV